MDRKRIFPILLIIFTNILGAGMILPTLPLYATGQFGATFFQAALLASAFFGAQFFAAPWLGRLSDLHGRRPILIISQMGTVVSFLLFIFAGQIGSIIDTLGLNLGISGGLLMLFIARSLDGITGGNITTARAYITDVSSIEKRTQALGLLSAAFGSAFIFGPALGGLLGGFGIIAPFIGATIITVITLLLTTFTLEESLPPEKRTEKNQAQSKLPLREIFTNRDLSTILIIGFINTLAFSAVPPILALFSEQVLFPDISEQSIVVRNVGFMLTFFGIASVLTQAFLLQALVTRIGERSMVLLGHIVLIFTMVGISRSSSFLTVTLLFAPFAFSRGITDPPLQSLITRFGNPQIQGRLLGLYQSALSLAFIFGPAWSGFVFENLQPSAVFLVGSIILIPGTILAYILRRRPLEPAA